MNLNHSVCLLYMWILNTLAYIPKTVGAIATKTAIEVYEQRIEFQYRER